jgi:hypoxanthine phosphoribosyltransferase
MKEILNYTETNLAIRAMTNRICSFSVDDLCFIGILKGGVYTMHEILPYFDFNILIGYLGLSSYRNGINTEEKIDITYPLDLSSNHLYGKNVWIVDDIFDSGLTITKAKSIIKEIGGYNSLRTAVLVRKTNPKVVLWKNESDLPDVVGFEYEQNGFLVGSGMGKGERFRCLNGLWELETEEIEK